MKRCYLLLIILFAFNFAYSQKKSNMFERKENFIDIRDQLELYSMILSKYSTPPIWQTIMSTLEFDEAILLPDNNLLFGAIDLKPISSHQLSLHNRYALFPNYHSLYKIDSKTGTILWEYGRNGQLGISSYQIIDVSDKSITIFHTEKNIAKFNKIDLEKGNEVWNLPVEPNSNYMVFYASSTLFISNSGKNELKYSGYSLKDNQLLYSKSLTGISDTCNIEQLGSGCVLILDGNKIFLINSATGEVKNSIVNNSKYIDAFAFDKTFLVSSDNAVQLLTNEGTSIWNKKLDYYPFLCSSAGDTLYWIRYNGSTNLVSVNGGNGEVNWQSALDGPVKSKMYFSNGMIAITTAKSLFILNSRNGNLVKQIDLKLSQLRAPDRIEEIKGQWVVVSESGIACYNIDSLNALWHYDLSGYYKSISDYSSDVESLAALNNMSVQNKNDNKRYGVSSSGYGISSSDKFVLDAQRNSDYWEHEYSKNPSSWTRNMSISATNGYINTLTVNKSFDQMMANWNLIMAGQSAGMAIGEVIRESKIKEYDFSALKRAQAIYSLATKANTLMRQGEYYIRKFETKKAVSLFIANINNGKWAEIVLSPDEGKEVDEEALLKTCFYVYNPIMGIISSNGLGLNPDKWEPVEIQRTTTVKRSIISYKINDIKFFDYKEYPSKSVVMKK